MDDLVQFLRERLDEEERIARQATGGPWIAEVSGETGNCVIPADAQSTREYVAKTQLFQAAFDADHIARHDPARVLADIEAKRQLLAEALDDYTEDGSGMWWKGEATVRLLALPYADHADYRPEWKP